MSTFIPATQTAPLPPAPAISNRTAAELLFDVATILELSEDNPYRVRAYRRAARLLLRQQDQASVHLDQEWRSCFARAWAALASQTG